MQENYTCFFFVLFARAAISLCSPASLIDAIAHEENIFFFVGVFFFFLSFPFFIIFRFSVFGGPSWVAAVSLFLRLTTSSMTFFFFRFSCCVRHIERHTHKYRWEDSIRNRSHLPRRRCICSPPPPYIYVTRSNSCSFEDDSLWPVWWLEQSKKKNENKNKQTNKKK